MLTITTKPGCELLLIEWPKNELGDNVEGCEICGEHPFRLYQLLSFYGEADAIALPPGQWEFVATTETITEKQAAQIMPKEWGGFAGHIEGFKDFGPIRMMDEEPLKTALDSLGSCITARGGLKEITYAILRKQ